MGQASSLPPSQPLRSRHRGDSWSSGSQPRRKASTATAFKHIHPHHDPRPLSEAILSAKTVVVPREGALSHVIHRNTSTWQTESPDSHMLSFPFTLTWVKATGTQSCAEAVLRILAMLQGLRCFLGCRAPLNPKPHTLNPKPQTDSTCTRAFRHPEAAAARLANGRVVTWGDKRHSGCDESFFIGV